MSSAAVQAVQQPGQHFAQASPARDLYPQQLPGYSSSPTSSRKEARVSGGNGSAASSPQQQQYHASGTLSPVTPPRNQPQPTTRDSPLSARVSAATYGAQYMDSPGPASASQQQQQQPYNSPASGYSISPTSARTSQPQATPYHPDFDPAVLAAQRAAASSGRPRRASLDSQAAQTSSGRARGSSNAGAQSRSTSGAVAPPSLPREDSTILDRLVIADPAENAEREQARMAEARPAPAGTDITPITGLGLVGSEGVDDGGRGGQRSRQEHLKGAQPRKETRFGEYILGQTVGEGEFGKVKMGWKKEGGVQVAIKLIRRESLGNNPNRLPKIYREIAILRGLQHPNIVRLHEMVETERHIGIILEYASGGELFDYILNHRYLKDNAARRLFAQLVSGVGYLHKKGIVHRDLKLENLLLDRNRNIIITDFGFANTFNANDELGDEIEYNLSNKDFVQKMNLEHLQDDGHRRGDLMQTSCGSPCYAAPELVVSDSLYTGRKVDVWSCGVILYAMLAGYLPFDDDPANPEGDNINLLYKYIVSTPLTFPEYVTPHARDLLRRILVPDPRKRADLFEVARHSWLSEYAHVVGFITSSTTNAADVASTTVPAEEHLEAPAMIGRSASVREPAKANPETAGALTSRHTPIDIVDQAARTNERDTKRRTVQVEYVAPPSQTPRVDAPVAAAVAAAGRSRARGDITDGPVGVSPTLTYAPSTAEPKAHRPVTQTNMSPPTRPQREPPRSVSDSTGFTMSPTPSARPSSTIGENSRLPSRGNSYSRPVAATVATTNVQGRFSQPAKSGYVMPGSTPADGRDPSARRPLSQHLPADYQVRPSTELDRPGRQHRRTSTVENITQRIFGRSNSTRRQSQLMEPPASRPEKSSRSHPPVSMKASVPNDPDVARPSMDSRRPSFGFGRKSSDATATKSSQRFSFLPSAFSRMSLSGAPKDPADYPVDSRRASVLQAQSARNRHSGMAFGQGISPSASQETTNTIPVLYDSSLDRRPMAKPTHGPQRGATAPDLLNYGGTTTQQSYAKPQTAQAQQAQQYAGYTQQAGTNQDALQPLDSHDSQLTPSERPTQAPKYPPGFNGPDAAPRSQRQVLQKTNRKFADQYETGGGTGGSSSSARRVMDWFRKRGNQRAA